MGRIRIAPGAFSNAGLVVPGPGQKGVNSHQIGGIGYQVYGSPPGKPGSHLSRASPGGSPASSPASRGSQSASRRASRLSSPESRGRTAEAGGIPSPPPPRSAYPAPTIPAPSTRRVLAGGESEQIERYLAPGAAMALRAEAEARANQIGRSGAGASGQGLNCESHV